MLNHNLNVGCRVINAIQNSQFFLCEHVFVTIVTNTVYIYVESICLYAALFCKQMNSFFCLVVLFSKLNKAGCLLT